MTEFRQKSYDVKVRTITKVVRQKESGETTYYRLLARDKEGINEFIITSALPFDTMSPKETVLNVLLRNSQVSLQEFGPEQKRGRPKKKGG